MKPWRIVTLAALAPCLSLLAASSALAVTAEQCSSGRDQCKRNCSSGWSSYEQRAKCLRKCDVAYNVCLNRVR